MPPLILYVNVCAFGKVSIVVEAVSYKSKAWFNSIDYLDTCASKL